jgi:hypothetical protein
LVKTPLALGKRLLGSFVVGNVLNRAEHASPAPRLFHPEVSPVLNDAHVAKWLEDTEVDIEAGATVRAPTIERATLVRSSGWTVGSSSANQGLNERAVPRIRQA